MANPILYSFDISPPVLAVRSTAAAIGLELDIRFVLNVILGQDIIHHCPFVTETSTSRSTSTCKNGIWNWIRSTRCQRSTTTVSSFGTAMLSVPIWLINMLPARICIPKSWCIARKSTSASISMRVFCSLHWNWLSSRYSRKEPVKWHSPSSIPYSQPSTFWRHFLVRMTIWWATRWPWPIYAV